MSRLKERNRQIPNGLKFKCAPLHFQSNNWHSFDRICRDVFTKIRSNPALARKHNLPDTLQGVEDMVDAYNAMICEQNGWLDYIQGGPDHADAGPPPKWMPQQAINRLGGKLAAGARSLLQWLGEGGEPVKPALAESRAAICVKCPLNKNIELKDFFVQGASELIRRQIEFAKECSLDTIVSKDLGICNACGCPLKLMVHIPIEHKLSGMTKESFDALDSKCWVRSERGILEPSDL